MAPPTNVGKIALPPGAGLIGRTKQDVLFAREKPPTLALRVEGIPARVRDVAHWMPWHWEKAKPNDPASRWSKPPLSVKTGQCATWTTGENWLSFDTALAYYHDHPGQVDGLGWVLTKEDLLLCLDLDELVDPATGQLRPEAVALLVQFDSWGEASVSKTGAHALAVGTWPTNGGKFPFAGGKLEIFPGPKFIIFTGWTLEGVPQEPQPRQEQINQLAAQLLGNDRGNVGQANESGLQLQPSTPQDLATIDVLERAGRARNGVKFSDLMNGRWQNYGYDSQSEADCALIALLLFYAGRDKEKARDVFQQSALNRPYPAKGQDYLDRTIDFVYPLQTEYWGNPAWKPAVNGQAKQGPPEDGKAKRTLYRLWARLQDRGPSAVLQDREGLSALAALQEENPELHRHAIQTLAREGVTHEALAQAQAGELVGQGPPLPTPDPGRDGTGARQPLNVFASTLEQAGPDTQRGEGTGEGEGAGDRRLDPLPQPLANGPTEQEAATSEAATSEAATSEAATSEAATSEAATSEAATSEAATSHNSRSKRRTDRSYVVDEGRLCSWRKGKEGWEPVSLCNFVARIVEETLYDSGSGKPTRFVTVEGTLDDGTPLPRAEVPAADFDSMSWIMPEWGADAIIDPAQGRKSRLCHAIKLLSSPIPKVTVYTHTGWITVAGKSVYLSAGCVIGERGVVEGVRVALSPALAAYQLPPPPQGQQLIDAVRASLKLRTVGPRQVLIPLLAAAYRAPLGETDYTVAVYGPTGSAKSELLALASQHYGSGMVRKQLPANFTSTPTFIEGLQHEAKDAVLGIDDYAPQSTRRGREEQTSKAERIGRNQGNAGGRGRGSPTGIPQAPRRTRCLLLTTGEDLPPGESLLARHLVLYLRKGEIPLKNLTPFQKIAADGVYAQALAGYLRWLAPQYAILRQRLESEQARLRNEALKVLSAELHARTVDIVASLAWGWELFLRFAQEVGAMDQAQRGQLWTEGWDALWQAAAAQVEHLDEDKPADLFERRLRTLLASGRAHLAGFDGNRPPNPRAWGWQMEPGSPGSCGEERFRSQGERIGFLDGTTCYLLFDAAFKAVSEFCRALGDAFPLRAMTTKRALHEASHLGDVYRSGDRTRFTRKVQLAGEELDVVRYLPFCKDRWEGARPPDDDLFPDQ